MLSERFKQFTPEEVKPKHHILKRSIREKLVFAVAFIVILYLLITVRLGFVSLTSNFYNSISLNPVDMLVATLKQDPFALILMIVIDGALSFGVAKYMTREPDEDVYSGAKLVDTKIYGVKRPMTEAQLREFYDYRKPNDPDGKIFAEDRETGELITLPWTPKDVNTALSNDNIFLCGQSGTRKTSSELLPNIYNRLQAGHAIFTTDTKGEIYEESVAQAKYLGYNIKVFNCLGDQFEHSDGWDCLKPVRESKDPTAEARQIANIILDNLSSGKGVQFWNDSNMNCFVVALLYVARAKGFVPLEVVNDREEGATTIEGYDDPYRKYRTFGEVIDLIMSGDTMASNISAAIEENEEDRKLLGNVFNVWHTNTQAEQIQSGLGIALSIFDNPNIKEVLSHDEIDFKDLDGKKTIIYVICSDKDTTFKPLLTLFTSFMFKETMNMADCKQSKALDKPLAIILEECGNIGEIPELSAKVATVRSRNISIFFCFQTIGQLKDTYASSIGERHNGETILANTAMVICTGANDEETAEFFSNLSGVENIEKESVSENYGRFDLWKGAINQGHGFSIERKPVFTPDQVMDLAVTDVMLFPSGHHNPTLQKKYYYKKHPLYTIKPVSIETNKVIKPLTTYRIPVWAGGDPESFFRSVKTKGNGVPGLDIQDENGKIESSHSFKDFK